MCRRRGHLVSAVTAGHTTRGAPNSHSDDWGAQECSAGSFPKGLILLGKLPYRRKRPSAERKCSSDTSCIIVPSRIEIAWTLSFLTVLLFDIE